MNYWVVFFTLSFILGVGAQDANVISGEALGEILHLTDGLFDNCLPTKSDDERSFVLPVITADVNRVVLHFADATEAKISVLLDRQSVRCDPATDRPQVYECSTESDSIRLTGGSISIQADTEYLGICELEIFANADGDSDDFDDDNSNTNYDIDIDGSGDFVFRDPKGHFEFVMEMSGDLDWKNVDDEDPWMSEGESRFDEEGDENTILAICFGLILGAAATAIIATFAYTRFIKHTQPLTEIVVQSNGYTKEEECFVKQGFIN